MGVGSKLQQVGRVLQLTKVSVKYKQKAQHKDAFIACASLSWHVWFIPVVILFHLAVTVIGTIACVFL